MLHAAAVEVSRPHHTLASSDAVVHFHSLIMAGYFDTTGAFFGAVESFYGVVERSYGTNG